MLTFMQNLFRVLLCNLLFFGFVTVTHGLTVPASEDSTGSGQALTKAAGASSVLTVDASRTSFLYFDLSDIPSDAVLRWAKLRMYLPVVRSKGAGLGVHLVTSEWNEALASAQPSTSSGTVAIIGPEKLASKRFVTVDVTPTVQGWVSGKIYNEGFAIKPLSAGTAGVTSLHLPSKEGIFFGVPAELDLEFKPEAGSGTLIDVNQLSPSLRSLFSPKITTQPTLNGGTLMADASGIGDLYYEWRLNNVVYAEGLNLKSLDSPKAGTYVVKVSNSMGSNLSSPFNVTGLPPKPADILGMKFISAGSFAMGDSHGDSELAYDTPVQAVYLDAFWIGETEVPLSEWISVRDWAVQNGYSFSKDAKAKANDHPAEVNWFDAVKWCNAKSQKEGKVPVYYATTWKSLGDVVKSGTVDVTNAMVKWDANGYRLPTGAEWEKAGRGGLVGQRFPSGNTISHQFANYNSWESIVFDVSPTRGYHPTALTGTTPYTMAVKSFPPNGFGLYDMAGNVYEWCWDRGSSYTPEAKSNPRGVDIGASRQARGGCWRDGPMYSRVDNHFMSIHPINYPTASYPVGFRYVLNGL